MGGALSSSPGGCHAPCDAGKSWPTLTMVVGQLEVEVVRRNSGQLPSEQPLTAPVAAAVGPTAAMLKEGQPDGEGGLPPQDHQ